MGGKQVASPQSSASPVTPISGWRRKRRDGAAWGANRQVFSFLAGGDRCSRMRSANRADRPPRRSKRPAPPESRDQVPELHGGTDEDPTNAAVITQCGGIPLVIQCLSSPVRNTVNYALGTFYYLYNPLTKKENLNPDVLMVVREYAAAGDGNTSFSNLANAFLDKHVNSCSELQRGVTQGCHNTWNKAF